MKRITVYKPVELKRNNPVAFERAHKHWAEERAGMDIPWATETIDSIKRIFEASHIALRDYSIGAYSESYVRFDMGEAGELTGQRATAWLENNLFGPLRITNNHTTKGGQLGDMGFALAMERGKPLQNLRYNASYRGCGDVRPYSIGKVPPCPFTGYYADDEYIDCLQKNVREGMTLQDAYADLARVASKLLEQDAEQAVSEEEFLAQEDLEITKDGRII